MEREASLAYILDWKFGPDSGVGRKVIDQVTSWNSFGLHTSLVVACPKRSAWEWANIEIAVAIFPYTNIVSRSYARRQAVQFAVENGLNILYTRFGILSPHFVKKMDKIPTVLELNFKGFAEHRRRSKLLSLYLIRMRKKAFKRSVGACAVTPEIASEFSEVVQKKIPCNYFPNSINLSQTPILKSVRNSKTNFVFIGSPGMVSHGVDRIEKLAETFSEYNFHVIGPKASSHKRDNVIYTGELYGETLYKYLEKMDIAISVLALERNGLREATPLKTRLYLGLGLPVILGYRDPSFELSAEFLCSINTTNWPLDQTTISKIREFVNLWSARRVNRDLVQCIDTLNTEKIRVEFIKKIYETSCSESS